MWDVKNVDFLSKPHTDSDYKGVIMGTTSFLMQK